MLREGIWWGQLWQPETEKHTARRLRKWDNNSNNGDNSNNSGCSNNTNISYSDSINNSNNSDSSISHNSYSICASPAMSPPDIICPAPTPTLRSAMNGSRVSGPLSEYPTMRGRLHLLALLVMFSTRVIVLNCDSA